jgi:hypothetical protein
LAAALSQSPPKEGDTQLDQLNVLTESNVRCFAETLFQEHVITADGHGHWNESFKGVKTPSKSTRALELMVENPFSVETVLDSLLST